MKTKVVLEENEIAAREKAIKLAIEQTIQERDKEFQKYQDAERKKNRELVKELEEKEMAAREEAIKAAIAYTQKEKDKEFQKYKEVDRKEKDVLEYKLKRLQADLNAAKEFTRKIPVIEQQMNSHSISSATRKAIELELQNAISKAGNKEEYESEIGKINKMISDALNSKGSKVKPPK